MIVLFKNLVEREHQRVKIQAALQGVQLDEEKDEHPDIVRPKFKPSSFKFGDPKDYEHLTDEQKQKLTDNMMGKHQIWKNQTSLG